MLTPLQAYDKALKEGPSDDTRKAVLFNSVYAYRYAYYIDKRPTEDTRNAILSNSYYAYYYAIDIDKVIFADDDYIHYFIDLYNIGMKHINENKCNTGFMAFNILYLDVL